jgi:3-deoxy-7-phosphoheptulonate synthase
MPIGFKNGTDGNLQTAVNAILSAHGAHHFLGIDEDGRTCVVQTRGNRNAHIILRGGDRPNYDPVSIYRTVEQLKEAGLAPGLIVDCSHGNSGKIPHLQSHVLRDIVQQRVEGNDAVAGAMLESNLQPGSQKSGGNPADLAYGVSITDACIGWEETEELLRHIHGRLNVPENCRECPKVPPDKS